MSDPRPTRRSILSTAAATAATLAGGADAVTRATSDDDGSVHEEYTVDVHPGTPVWVRLDVDPGDREDLRYEPPERVSVQDSRAFDAIGDRLVWDGGAHPQVVYSVSPRFTWGLGPDSGLVSVAELTLPATVSRTRSVTLANGGHLHPDPTGQSYVGPATTHRRTVAGTTVTYVQPDRWDAPAAPEPDTFFGLVETTAASLGIDDPYPVVGYAAATLDGAEGFATRATVADTTQPHFAFVGESLPTVAHEYVHTQQAYLDAREYAWIREGFATFFEHLAGYRHGIAPLSPLDGPSPAQPLQGARRTSVVYDKGAALVFLLDQRLQELSDGATTAGDVFAGLNAAAGDEPLGHERFKEIVATVGNVRLDAWLDERVVDPFEIGLDSSLEQRYPGPERPRPRVARTTRTATPARDSLLLVDFAVDPLRAPPETLSLQVSTVATAPVQVSSVTTTGTASAGTTVSRSHDGSTHSLDRSFGDNGPDSLVETAPVRVSLAPTRTGATTATITGTVTPRDGEQVSLSPVTVGLRGLVDSGPPPEPSVRPRGVPAGKPAELFVLDPSPDHRYLWRFDGSDAPQALGPRVVQRFSRLGEQEVRVTAVDRTGRETTTSTTITVTEGVATDRAALIDDTCLLRTHSATDGRIDDGISLSLLRQCYEK